MLACDFLKLALINDSFTEEQASIIKIMGEIAFISYPKMSYRAILSFGRVFIIKCLLEALQVSDVREAYHQEDSDIQVLSVLYVEIIETSIV